MLPKHSCLIGLVFVSYLLQAQEVNWVQTYEVSPHGTGAFDVISLSAQGFVVAGNAIFPPDSGNFQGWVMRTDLQGDVVWSRTYGDSTPETFTSVTLMNNQLWIAGHNSSWPILYRIDLMGDSLWYKVFSEWELGRRLDRILATPDGNLLVTSDHPVVSKLNALGNLVWSVRGPEYHNTVRALALLPDGGYVVACNTNYIWDFQDTIAIRIYWVNEEGVVLDSADFTHYRWNYADCILPISQDEVVVGGFSQPGQAFYDEYPLVFRINRAGQVAWEFIGSLDDIGREITGVQVVNDTIWAVSYNLHSELGARSPYMYIFDPSGDLQGGLVIDVSPVGDSYDDVRAIASVQPAAIIVAGSTFGLGSVFKAFLAQISSASGTGEKWRGTKDLPLRAEFNIILGSETAVIELPEPIQGEVSIVIYDILGRTVYRTRQLMSNTQFVSFPMRAPSGMYFVTATHGQHQWHGKAILCR